MEYLNLMKEERVNKTLGTNYQLEKIFTKHCKGVFTLKRVEDD
jgi:hypothetical protein